MIPQSELDRIEKEAWNHKNYKGHAINSSMAEGYIAGASSEYLRSASRIQELLQAAREVVKQYDNCHISINEYQDVCFKMEEMNQFESALKKLEVTIAKFTTKEQ